MNNLESIAREIENSLIDFSPVVIKYGKDMVVGFPNEGNGSDLVIHVKKDEVIMSFGFQNAHFELSDITSIATHTKKYLTGEYSSVEFFKGEVDLFGGSRLSSTVDFSTAEKIADCYSCGMQKAKDGVMQLFRENGEITVRAVSFDNKINKVATVKCDGENYIVTELR
ncbi:MAG: hypothetical protein IKL82_05585 [Clostridia bacterium]|nr:hypothetical protein [Clostridia bacterium]